MNMKRSKDSFIIKKQVLFLLSRLLPNFLPFFWVFLFYPAPCPLPLNPQGKAQCWRLRSDRSRQMAEWFRAQV
jgi:hypothetical protein